ncbi:MAG TPA: ABC transporter permease [Gemmatimonadaceae bacterium]|nr:ABC transporter permease [Gemmatimonadaceae bacterium]
MRRPSLADRLRGWRRRLRALLDRRAAERELAAELAFHLEMETEERVRAGMSPAEARRAARLAFGGVDRYAEAVRDVRDIGWLEELRHDLRYAARSFRRAPGFTAAAVAALALGIGANTAVFAVVHAVVLAPLPYAEPERLVRLWERNLEQHVEHGPVSPGTFVELRARSHTLQRLALFGERDMIFSEDGETWQSHAAAVSPALFDLLGVRPVLGRALPPEGDRGAPDGRQDEMVIGYGLWQRRFGGDPAVVGRTVRMDERWSYTIVGVMPPGFAFPVGTELWVPLTYGPTVSPVERQFRYYGMVGQLRPGYTPAQAAQESAAIAARLGAEFPASNAGWSVALAPLDRSIVGATRPTLLVLLGLAGCVLLIACGNVATLAVARAAARQHETAVRVALGAGRQRLLRQWAAEGLLLALLGGAAGVVVGYWSGRLLLALAPADLPRLEEVAFGGPVLLFALALTGATALMVGLAPALRARRTTPLAAMRGGRTDAGGTGGARPRAWLLGAQVALTMVLTVAAALLLRSFERLQAVDLGYRRHDVLAAEVRVPIGRFRANPDRPWFERAQYYDQLLTELGRLPGVRSVAGITTVPLTGEIGSGSLWRTDAPGAHGRRPPTSAADQWTAAIQVVTPGYFATMGIPVLRGRGFTADDRFTQRQLTEPGAPRPPGVAVVNEAFARRYWPDGDPVGQRVFLFDDQSYAAYRTIVGVVRDARVEAVAAPASPAVFLPFAQHPGRELSLVLRTDLPPARLVAPVTDRLRAFGAVTVVSVRPLDAVVAGTLARPRFTLLLVASFAALALLIASVGVSGGVGFLVARRTQEIGLRMALGAAPRRVLWLMLREGLRPVLLGLGIGAIGAVAVARAMRVLLYGVPPLDGASFAAAAAILLAAAVVAAVLPARRAAGVDPLRALRSE